MGRKSIRTEHINDRTSLSLCKDGYWLYDKSRGMNLAMHTPTEKSALIEALEYYQSKLALVEASHRDLIKKVESFVNTVSSEEENWEMN